MLTPSERRTIEQFHTWGAGRTPGSRVIESQDWFQIISEDYKTAAYNEILFSHCSDSEIEGRIVDAIKVYQDIGTDFKWCVFPHSAPHTTGELLLKYGFQNWQSRMMYAHVGDFDVRNLAAEIEVQEVERGDMDAFIDLFMRCWNIDPKESALIKQLGLFDNLNTTAEIERFIAFSQGRPAGVASMVRNSDCGYLHATAVLPEFQGRGIYRALVEARLKSLKMNQINLAIAGAREKTSAPRLEKMGFKTAWPVQMFLKKFETER